MVRREDGGDCGSSCDGGDGCCVRLATDADRKFKPVARFAVGLSEGDFCVRFLAETLSVEGTEWTFLCCMWSLNEMLVVSSEGGQSIEVVEDDEGLAAAGVSAVARMDLMLDRTKSDPEGLEVRDGPRVDFALLALFPATWPTPTGSANDLL